MLEGTHPTDPRIRFAQAQKENRLPSERIKKTMKKILQKAMLHSLFLLSVFVFLWMIMGFVLTLLGI